MLRAVSASMGGFSKSDIKCSLKGQSWALKRTEWALGELDWSLNLALIIIRSWLGFWDRVSRGSPGRPGTYFAQIYLLLPVILLLHLMECWDRFEPSCLASALATVHIGVGTPEVFVFALVHSRGALRQEPLAFRWSILHFTCTNCGAVSLQGR